MENTLSTPFALPCGIVIKNRLVKAAMTDRGADQYTAPTDLHERLYGRWADTGAGLLITGNVMVDRVHLESAGNVCFDNENISHS